MDKTKNSQASKQGTEDSTNRMEVPSYYSSKTYAFIKSILSDKKKSESFTREEYNATLDKIVDKLQDENKATRRAEIKAAVAGGALFVGGIGGGILLDTSNIVSHALSSDITFSAIAAGGTIMVTALLWASSKYRSINRVLNSILDKVY